VVAAPYLITLTHESARFPTFQHERTEIHSIHDGVVDDRPGDNTYRLEPGDTLMFGADCPRRPEDLITLPARYRSVIRYPQQT